MQYLTVVSCLAFSFALTGCERKSDSASKSTATPTTATSTKGDHVHKNGDDHAHDTHDGHEHEEQPARDGHSGEVIELGSANIGDKSVRASRDKGPIIAGGDAPVDVWIDDGTGKDVSAVRFWIGSEDAKGSIKAKAEIEDGKWHTHAEIPDPIPAGSKLWIQIEMAGGAKLLGSFDLKM